MDMKEIASRGNAVLTQVFAIGTTADEQKANFFATIAHLTTIVRDAILACPMFATRVKEIVADALKESIEEPADCTVLKALGFDNIGQLASDYQAMKETIAKSASVDILTLANNVGERLAVRGDNHFAYDIAERVAHIFATDLRYAMAATFPANGTPDDARQMITDIVSEHYHIPTESISSFLVDNLCSVETAGQDKAKSQELILAKINDWQSGIESIIKDKLKKASADTSVSAEAGVLVMLGITPDSGIDAIRKMLAEHFPELSAKLKR